MSIQGLMECNGQVTNMDEKPVQLIEETRTPIPATPGKPMRYAYEYERKGNRQHLLVYRTLKRLASS